jgi:hypothetical protein
MRRSRSLIVLVAPLPLVLGSGRPEGIEPEQPVMIAPDMPEADHVESEALRDPLAEPVQREARPSAPPMPVGLNYWDEEVDEPDDWWVAPETMSMGTPLALMACLDEENA